MNCIVVDDEELSLEFLLKELENFSEISSLAGFSDPLEALRYAQNHPIDIAFLDIEMFGMNGICLTEQLQKQIPDIAIVFITGYAQYALDAFAVRARGYLLKPVSTERLREEVNRVLIGIPSKQNKRIFVRTFGHFDVFVDGKIVRFHNSRSKEFLAYLIDRRGCAVTNKQAISILWEDRPDDNTTGSLFRIAVADLRKTLKEVHAENLLVDKRNSRSVDPSLIDCDYYHFLDGDPASIRAFLGEYMMNYSWGEFTTASLAAIKEKFTKKRL